MNNKNGPVATVCGPFKSHLDKDPVDFKAFALYRNEQNKEFLGNQPTFTHTYYLQALLSIFSQLLIF
ncbi:hypothetical protein L596_019598 [Steinernema carpocapsae]|uniref:Uncharacterized protein n=1 Tax=Steinernema carpocapsae TaxID=34508 RepID=A0A4U5MR37_STECR|nr:hypothetical protein L596_019598 [Steinernema carpocapsae]